MKSFFDIEIGGKSMAIPQNQSLDIEERNPLFNDVEMMSFPLQLPFDYNRGVFKNLDACDSDLRANDVEGQTAHLILGGMPFRTCKLRVQENETLKDTISVNFDSRTKSFKDMISNMKCREVPVADTIYIGEKIGQIHTRFTYRSKLTIWYLRYGDSDNYGTKTDQYPILEDVTHTKEADFTPPALGFSYPGRCTYNTSGIPEPVDKREYTQPDITVNVPPVIESFINVSEPYPTKKYCNSRVCYAHHAYDAEKKETSDEIVTDDPDNYNNEGYGSYWVLPADRPASGICFYIAYFLECLFRHLGVAYDISALTNIEDFNYLAFFTTACKFDEYSAHIGTGYDLPDMDHINRWLNARGCGAKVDFDPNGSNKKRDVKEYTINGTTYRNGDYITIGGKRFMIDHMQATVVYDAFAAAANVSVMKANSENFPDATVTEIISSLEASFGCRFQYDPEINKVTVVLLRDVFRSQKAPIHLNAHINSMFKMTEKLSGVRMKYSSESDPDEQRENVRTGKRDYNTDYDYIEYPENRTVVKRYRDTVQKISATDMNVYVDPITGNAIRIKVDKEATTAKEMKPVAFEVGQYKGIEVGDCSDDNEDNIMEIVSDFQPIVVNDVNFRNGGANDPDYQPLLVPYVDEDMEREFVETRIQNPFVVDDLEIYFTYYLRLMESYDPTSTEDGQSPLMNHDWGLSIGILRTGDGGAGVENFDPNYDGFGNWRWRDIADNYCMSSDTMDQSGLWLGKTDKGNTFSLKIRAWKPFLYYIDGDGRQHITADMTLEGQPVAEGSPYTWLLAISDDIRDANGKITHRYRSRGLADVFMAEYIRFLLERHKFKVKGIVEIAQLADIPKHWNDRYEIEGRIGLIDNLKYSVDEIQGIGEVEMDFYSM